MDVDIIIYIMSHTQSQGDFDHSDVVVNRLAIILVKCINETGSAAANWGVICSIELSCLISCYERYGLKTA